MRIDRNCLGRIFLLILLLTFVLAACASTAKLREQARSHIDVGTAYLASGQYNAALKELLEAEKLTPDDARLRYLLGITYHRKSLDERAVVEFQRALSIRPDDSEVHNYLGAIHLEKGRYDAAIASFERALANILYDAPAAALYNMGRAYYEKGQYDAALKSYREAAAREPNTVLMPWIEMGMGMARLSGGNPEQAVVHLRKALEIAPSLAEPHYWLGLCYRELNQPDKAREAFQTAVRLAPESAFAPKAKEHLKILAP
jgi:Tfp pilus assembly protein PilF